MFGTVEFKKVLAFGDCLICYGELAGTRALAHDGKCEPCHEDCIKTWVKVNDICPKCHATVDTNLLFSWKDRDIKNDALAFILVTGISATIIVTAEVAKSAGLTGLAPRIAQVAALLVGMNKIVALAKEGRITSIGYTVGMMIGIAVGEAIKRNFFIHA